MSFDARALRRQMMADKKKLGALLALGMFGLLLWGRLLLKDVPRTATARPLATTAAAMMADKTAINSVPAARRLVEVALVGEVRRDVFSPDISAYQQIAQEKTEIQLPQAKSDSDPADELERKQQMIRAEARKLSLQSTLLGTTPRAMINRVLVSVGEKIQGFELLEIRSRQVTLQKDGVIVVLEM